jgi:hypothetical protein
VETLQGQKRELLASSSLSSLGENGVTGLKDKLWELEAKAREHEKVQSQQKSAIEHLEQVGAAGEREGRLVDKGTVQDTAACLLIPLWLPMSPGMPPLLQDQCHLGGGADVTPSMPHSVRLLPW